MQPEDDTTQKESLSPGPVAFAAAKNATNPQTQQQEGSPDRDAQHEAKKTKQRKSRWQRLVTLWRKTEDEPNTLFTFILVVFNGLFFVVNIASFLAARSAANAANRSALMAERALTAGDRAFVSVMFKYLSGLSSERNELIDWNFSAVWLNTGNTPH